MFIIILLEFASTLEFYKGQIHGLIFKGFLPMFQVIKPAGL